MKIGIFLLLFYSLVISSGAQVVNIPDVNFKTALVNHVPVIDLNGDGQIQVSEAVAFTGTINVQLKNIADITGIGSFVNIQGFNCAANAIITLNLNNFSALRQLNCNGNQLTTLQLSNLPLLNTLQCEQNNFISLSISNLPALTTIMAKANTLMTSLNLDNLPLLNYLDCTSGFSLTSLTFNNIPTLTQLYCDGCKIPSLTFTNPAILKRLVCSNNKLTALPTGLSALQLLSCSNNLISSFVLDNLNALDTVNFEGNLCTSFSLSNKPQLVYFNCARNPITSLTLNNLPLLKWLYCNSGQLSSLTLSGFPSLQYLWCQNNLLTSLSVTNMPSLNTLICQGNLLTSLSFTNFPSIQSLLCDGNPLTSFTISNMPLLNELGCGGSNLTSLNLPVLPSLKYFYCNYSKLTSLSLINYPALQRVTLNVNYLSSLTLKNLPSLNELNCDANSFTALVLDSLPSLSVVYCGQNDSLRSLSLKLPSLVQLRCDSTKLTTLDLSQTHVTELFLRKNLLLQYVNLKNGVTSYYNSNYYYFNQCTALVSVCVDDSEVSIVTTAVNAQLPGQNVSVSSFCNFNPGGNYNTIIGTTRFDETANGCNNLDSTMANVRINITDGTQSGSTFTNPLGQYKIFAQLSPDTLTTSFQNNWFNTAPPRQILSFTGFGNTAVADFCLTANGIHPDLDIVLLPLGRARPGFDATYRLVYSNKGNKTESGNIALNFDNNRLTFVSAVPNPSSQTPGILSWSYNNLSPYQTRFIDLILHVFPPPIVHPGELLKFIAIINPIPGDETPGDNTDTIIQLVRSSFDPNEKEILEGSQITLARSKDYLHYIIHFQNTGTANTTRVIVKDSLADNLDWNSFVPLSFSHPCRTNLTKGKLVEFIFDSINLPPKTVNEPASNGFISFKIKPKNNLVLGDSILNTAQIYFDFNPAIITNTAYTVISKPVINTNTNNLVPIGLSVFPNPVNHYLIFNLKTGGSITKIRLFNWLGQEMNFTVTESAGLYRKLDISKLPSGQYVLEVITVEGKDSQNIFKLN